MVCDRYDLEPCDSIVIGKGTEPCAGRNARSHVVVPTRNSLGALREAGLRHLQFLHLRTDVTVRIDRSQLGYGAGTGVRVHDVRRGVIAGQSHKGVKIQAIPCGDDLGPRQYTAGAAVAAVESTKAKANPSNAARANLTLIPLNIFGLSSAAGCCNLHRTSLASTSRLRLAATTMYESPIVLIFSSPNRSASLSKPLMSSLSKATAGPISSSGSAPSPTGDLTQEKQCLSAAHSEERFRLVTSRRWSALLATREWLESGLLHPGGDLTLIELVD